MTTFRTFQHSIESISNLDLDKMKEQSKNWLKNLFPILAPIALSKIFHFEHEHLPFHFYLYFEGSPPAQNP